MRTLLATCLLVLSVSSAHAARGRTPAAVDTTSWRTIGYREPWTELAKQRAFPRMDSLATARYSALVSRQEPDSFTVGVALLDAVELGALAGRGREGLLLEQLERTLAIFRKHPGPDSLTLARAIRASSEVHRRRREFEPAVRDARRALAMFERALPADHLEVASSLRQVALIATNAMRSDAVEEGKRAVRIMESHFGRDDIRLMATYSALAGQLNIAGDEVGALEMMEHVAHLLELQLGPEHPDTQLSRYNVAILAMRVGDLVRARGLFESGIEWELARPRMDTLRVANSADALVECLNDLGDFEEAFAVQERARHLSLRAFRPDDPSHYEYLHQRGRALLGLGRGREAVACFDSTAAFEAARRDSLTALPILFERATALRVAGDTAAAMHGIELATRIAEREGDRAKGFYEGALLWAQCLTDAGRPAEAAAKLEPAIARAITELGAGGPLHAKLVAERARALVQMGDPRAFEVSRELAAMQAALLRTAARGFPDRQALVYARGSGLGLEPLLTLAAAGKLDDAQRRVAFDQVVEARSLVLDEVGGRLRAAHRGKDPRAQALLDSLADARGVLARWLVRAESNHVLDSLRREARGRAERFERQLADLGLPQDVPGEARPLDALRDGDALVSFLEYAAPAGGSLTERRMLAFVARPGAAPEVVALGRASELDALAARWREDVSRTGADAEARTRASGARLRARVWDPIAGRIAGAARLVIVPDGALHLVDFAALPDARGGYLAERAPLLLRLGAERDLALVRASDAPIGTLVALGGADFDGATMPHAAGDVIAANLRSVPVACDRFRDVRFGALPSTSDEVGELAERWRAAGREVVTLTGPQANEIELRRAASRAATLHIATHGFFVGGECATPAGGTRGIGGTAPAAATGSASAPSGRQTLRLSGLALAGANRRAAATGGDDGILTAEEISTMDLSGVHEVVLSACDTGLGDIAAGEGVLGLQRAFRLAGAHALVMSLWPVNDRATHDWMSAYYGARLEQGLGVAASVRAAQLRRLAALRAAKRPTPPAAWAGFVPLGD